MIYSNNLTHLALPEVKATKQPRPGAHPALTPGQQAIVDAVPTRPTAMAQAFIAAKQKDQRK